MNQLKLILLLVGSLVPIFLQAQAPGYLGKRATIGLHILNFPAIQGPTQNNKGNSFFGETGGGLGLNYEWEFQFSYATGRLRQLTFTAGQYYTATSTSFERLSLFNNPFSSTVNFDTHNLFLRLNVRSVGLQYYRFKENKASIAPVGNHFYYGLKVSFINGEIIDKITRFGNPIGEQLQEHAPLDFEQRHTVGTIFIGWSNDQIFWDRVIFSYGIRFGWTVGVNAISEPDSSSGDVFKWVANNRLFRHELARIDVGVKYLIF